MNDKVKARKSFGSDYECEYPWDFFVQCGDSGIVLSKDEPYETAFFEAFPKNPSCFLRGEGSSIEEAEKQCWNKYQKVLSCNHEMERRNRKDGYGYCKHCSYSSMVFEPLTRCEICEKPTIKFFDKFNNYYCEKHFSNVPVKNKISYPGISQNKRRLPRKYKKLLKNAALYKFGYKSKIFLKKSLTSIIRFESTKGASLSLFSKRNQRNIINEYKKT